MKNDILSLLDESAGLTAVRVTGDIDVTTARFLDEGLNQVTARARRPVVDLSLCPYMDSSGVSVLIRHARRSDAPLIVVAPAGCFARRVIDITGVRKILSLHETIAEALS